MIPSLHEVKIELTQQCSLACIHCSTESNRKRVSILPPETVLRLLGEAAQLGAQTVVFSGGEPLRVNYLVDVVQAASKLGLIPTIYTSGIRDDNLTPMSCDLAQRLRQAGLSRFIVSLYSHNPDVHNSITRYPSHAAMLAALRNLKTSGVPTELHFVAMRRNFRDLPGVVELAISLGFDRLSVLRLVLQGRAEHFPNEALTLEDLRELASSIDALRLRHPILALRTGSPFNILNICNAPCKAAKGVLVINHAGDIFPCDAFKNVHYPDAHFGNVRDQSLQNIWGNSLFLSEVRRILNAPLGSACLNCHNLVACQSGCLAQKVIQGGWQNAAKQTDPDCLVSHHPQDQYQDN